MNKSEGLHNLFDRATKILRGTSETLQNEFNFSSLSDLHSIRQYNGGAALCVTSIRFGKKLWVNDTSRTEELKQLCKSAVLDQERFLSKLTIPDSDRLEQAAELIGKWFRNLKLDRGSFKLSPGESFVSAKGRVSILQKLQHSVWTVTEQCKPLFSRIIASNRWLRRVFFQRLKEGLSLYQKAQLKEIISEAWQEALRQSWAKRDLIDRVHVKPFVGPRAEASTARINKVVKDARYYMIYLLIDYVCVTVEGSRASSVNKDKKQRRPINVEPLGNVVCQLFLGSLMKQSLKAEAGNDLFEGQAHHREMAADLSKATVDFSGASDSKKLDLIKRMFYRVPGLLANLLKTRSPACRFPRSNDVEHEFKDLPWFLDECEPENYVWVLLEKYASMGNGTTFEVLTSVLLAIARTYDPAARVYGDDVIIAKEHALDFCEYCTSLGFRVNVEKSFMNRGFRESCGAFYMEGFGEIRSYEFRAIENFVTWIVSLNKLYDLIRFYSKHSFSTMPRFQRLVEILRNTRNQLLSLFPGVERYLGPPSRAVHRDEVGNADPHAGSWVLEDRFIWDDNWDLLGKPARLKPEEVSVINSFLEHRGGGGLTTRRGFRIKPLLATPTVVDDVDVYRAATYFYATGVTPDEIRQDAASQICIRTLLVVEEQSGLVFDFHQAKRHLAYCLI